MSRGRRGLRFPVGLSDVRRSPSFVTFEFREAIDEPLEPFLHRVALPLRSGVTAESGELAPRDEDRATESVVDELEGNGSLMDELADRFHEAEPIPDPIDALWAEGIHLRLGQAIRQFDDFVERPHEFRGVKRAQEL